MFPPVHIAALVLAGLYLPTGHLAPEKLVTMTRQISSRRQDRLLLALARFLASMPPCGVGADHLWHRPIPDSLTACRQRSLSPVWQGRRGRTVGLWWCRPKWRQTTQ